MDLHMFKIFSKNIYNIQKILDFMTKNSQFRSEKNIFSSELWPLKMTPQNFKKPVYLNLFFSKN